MADVERRQDRSPVPSSFDYAPAPESRDIVRLDERYGLFIGGEFVEPQSGEVQPTIEPGDRGAARRGRRCGRGGRRRWRSAPRARPSRTAGRSSRRRERAKYLFRIARILQERAREFAVLESLDGGKPIQESRDVDVPLAAAHFFYYAGWADKLEYAFPNRRAAAARRGRPGHPVELPAADAGVEDRAGARARATRSC